MASFFDLSQKPELVQGLLSLGGGILANNTGHYGAFGPAVGRGIQDFGRTYYGALQQTKDNEMRKRQMDMLEKMQTAQIGNYESETQRRNLEIEQQKRALAAREGVFGELFGQKPQQPMSPGMGPRKVAPDPVSGAQIQIPGQMPVPQGTPIAENEAPAVDVSANAIPPMQNPVVLRQLAARLSAGQDKEGAAFLMQLATAAENQLNREEDKEDKTFTDSQGVVRYLRSGQPVADQKPKAPEGMQYNAKGELEPIPGYLGMRKEIAAAGKPSVNVQIDQKEDTEEAKTVGKFYGESYADIQKAGMNAQSKINRAQRMMSLLEGVQTGKLTPLGTEVASFAKSLGFNIDPNLGNKQAAEALANEMALELRNPSGGAGMPGAMSDKDREFLVSMVPSLWADPQGRKLMLDTQMKLAQRDKDVAKMARAYRKQHGKLNEGFYDQLEEWSAKNPLFPQAAPANPEIDSLLKKYGG